MRKEQEKDDAEKHEIALHARSMMSRGLISIRSELVTLRRSERPARFAAVVLPSALLSGDVAFKAPVPQIAPVLIARNTARFICGEGYRLP